jgi:osmotically-inducible protein OsmY
VATAACGRADTEENIRKALQQAKMRTVTVDVDRDAGIVHLQGTVDSAADRSRAEEVANAVVGTTGYVLNELTIVDDDRVTEEDRQLLDALDAAIDRDPVLRQRDINLQVVNRVVTVNGAVRSAAEKQRVTDIVRTSPGVKNLANALEIQPEP